MTTELGDGWRGEMGARVTRLERDESDLSAHYAQLSAQVSVMREDLAVMRVRMSEQSAKLTDLGVTIEKGRESDILELHATIERSRESTRNMLIYLVAPIIVLLVAGLALFLLTGSSSSGVTP